MTAGFPGLDAAARSIALLAALAAQLACAPALAQDKPAPAQGQEVPLRRSAEPARLLLPGAEALGLRLGDSPEQVLRALKAISPDMRIKQQQRRLTVTANGRQVTSVPYLSEIEASNDQAEPRTDHVPVTLISVAFALPTTGGGAVAFSTSQSTASTLRRSPTDRVSTYAAFRDQLVRAFGLPEQDRSVPPDQPRDPSGTSEDERGTIGMYWRYGSAGRPPNPDRTGSRLDSGEIELKSLADYEGMAAQGVAVRMNAMAIPAQLWAQNYGGALKASLAADYSTLVTTSIAAEDVANKALSLREAVRQLTEAAGGQPPK